MQRRTSRESWRQAGLHGRGNLGMKYSQHCAVFGLADRRRRRGRTPCRARASRTRRRCWRRQAPSTHAAGLRLCVAPPGSESDRGTSATFRAIRSRAWLARRDVRVTAGVAGEAAAFAGELAST
jgi:hypothetical protein